MREIPSRFGMINTFDFMSYIYLVPWYLREIETWRFFFCSKNLSCFIRLGSIFLQVVSSSDSMFDAHIWGFSLALLFCTV